uniref:Uncharacterized protein n=1 Tax=Paramormyrops kingsleyae TaxID=1676925 RepID=A0A3B3S6E4_9TELE
MAADKRCSWDELINKCMPVKGTDPPAVKLNTVALCSKTPMVSKSVWVSVAVIISVSLLALLLWCLIFRRERRPVRGAVEAGRPAEADAEAGRDRPAMAAEEEEPPAAFPYENGGPAGGQDPVDSIWREAVRCDERGESSAHVCNGRKEHGIPLPATELGDAALVTTKTVQ